MYTVYTSPIQVVDDFDTACIVADDYFNETGLIVAVEKNEVASWMYQHTISHKVRS